MEIDKDIIFAKKLGAVEELEYIIENYKDCPVYSPFNEFYGRDYLFKKLSNRLYQKKHKLKLDHD